VNTPPGSYRTVKEWIRESFLSRDSRVLELGCSSGFITTEIARYTGASCLGIDRNEPSVLAARGNVDSAIDGLATFETGDAGNLRFEDGTFSHTVVGGHLPFSPRELRRDHVAEAVRVTAPWRYLLTALYFYQEKPPERLIEDFNREVGTSLSSEDDYAYWSSLFDEQGLQLEHESIHRVEVADEARTREYLAHVSDQELWARRLALFNENGRYLRYFVRVYRRLPRGEKVTVQHPRGGIYLTSPIETTEF
jgi:ubiquinone/menaquinone biosynthesis C-methylase UbiE